MSEQVRSAWARHVPLPHSLVGVPWWRVLLWGLATVVTVLALAFGLLHTKLFTVDRIDIEGLAHYNREQVLQASKVHTGQFLFDIDAGAIRHRLLADPWIASVDVDRDWPHVLRIQVRERVPVGVAQTADHQWALIGDGGTVLEVQKTIPLGFPNLLGVEAPASPGARLGDPAKLVLEVATLMPDSLKHRVVQIDNNNDTGIRLGIDAGTVVIVGDDSQLGAKLMAAAAVLAHEDASKIAQLDVRSPAAPLATPVGAAKSTGSTSTSTTNSSASQSTSTTTKPSTSGTQPSTSTKSAGDRSVPSTHALPGNTTTSSVSRRTTTTVKP